MSDKYDKYLKSDYWKRVSDAVKARFGYKCAVCNSPHDLEAHHRCYSHRGRELEFIDDVVCLCRRCHGIFHGKVAPPPAPKPAEETELVWITRQNCKRLRCHKPIWHWMLENGINPRKSGWAERAIGFQVPTHWMH